MRDMIADPEGNFPTLARNLAGVLLFGWVKN
jgi:hypothetical protein